MQLSITADVSGLRQQLESEKRRLARVTRRVVNAAAFGALDDVRDEMRKSLDRPTPFVLRGPYVVPARDGDQFGGTEARVAWREFGSGPVTAEKVLRAQVEGGPRRLKRFERLLGLPANRVAVPAKWAPLDAYGNIPGPFLVQMLSALRSFGESGFRANRREGARLRRGQSEFFIIRPDANDRRLSPGVYRVAQDMGGAPLMVLAFVRAANYRQRIAPGRTVSESVSRNIGQLWQQGLAGTLPFRRN